MFSMCYGRTHNRDRNPISKIINSSFSNLGRQRKLEFFLKNLLKNACRIGKKKQYRFPFQNGDPKNCPTRVVDELRKRTIIVLDIFFKQINFYNSIRFAL